MRTMKVNGRGRTDLPQVIQTGYLVNLMAILDRTASRCRWAGQSLTNGMTMFAMISSHTFVKPDRGTLF